MTDRLHLEPRHRQLLEALLRKHLPDVDVWAYGSRVNGRSHDGSELDLALRWPELEEIPIRQLEDFEEAVRQSTIPFLVEARDWARLPERFHRKIERGYVALTDPPSSTGNARTRARLGDCIEFNDSTYSPRKDGWSFVNYLDTGNITANRIATVQRFDLDKDSLPVRARRKVRPGDIVLSTVRPNQRHFGILRDPPQNFLASTGFAVFRGRPDVADTDYLYWFLTQDQIVDQLQTIAEHSTSAYPSIRPADIENLEVSLPPLAEQRAIAHILGTLDDKIELNRRTNRTLEAVAQAIFQDWFVDFGPVRAKMEGRAPYLPPEIWDLFPDRLDDSELGDIPDGWKVSEIGAEVDVVGGGTPSTKEPTYWNGGRHYWATPKDLSKLSSTALLETDRKITDAGVRRISSGLLPPGTVLLSSRAPIGYLAITEVPTAVNQGFIAMICRTRLRALYVLSWCRENLEYIKDISGGSTFAEISKRTFRPLPVVVPSKGILGVYDETSRSLYKRVVSNTRESAQLAPLREALLPRLVSGELRMTGTEPESARDDRAASVGTHGT